MPGTSTKTQRPAVLLVDDAVDTLELFALWLHGQGVEVATESNPSQVLMRDDLARFGLVLMDFQLGGMDAIELALVLRQRDYRGRLGLLTGHHPDDLPQLSAYPALFDTILHKPVDRNQLFSAVSTVLGRSPAVPT